MRANSCLTFSQVWTLGQVWTFWSCPDNRQRDAYEPAVQFAQVSSKGQAPLPVTYQMEQPRRFVKSTQYSTYLCLVRHVWLALPWKVLQDLTYWYYISWKNYNLIMKWAKLLLSVLQRYNLILISNVNLIMAFVPKWQHALVLQKCRSVTVLNKKFILSVVFPYMGLYELLYAIYLRSPCQNTAWCSIIQAKITYHGIVKGW